MNIVSSFKPFSYSAYHNVIFQDTLRALQGGGLLSLNPLGLPDPSAGRTAINCNRHSERHFFIARLLLLYVC